MYAVIKTGGKQYRVTAGMNLKVESLAADVGSRVVLDQVLAVGEGDTVMVGAPRVRVRPYRRLWWPMADMTRFGFLSTAAESTTPRARGTGKITLN